MPLGTSPGVPSSPQPTRPGTAQSSTADLHECTAAAAARQRGLQPPAAPQLLAPPIIPRTPPPVGEPSRPRQLPPGPAAAPLPAGISLAAAARSSGRPSTVPQRGAVAGAATSWERDGQGRREGNGATAALRCRTAPFASTAPFAPASAARQ